MNKDFITLEEAKDQLLGEVGSPKRDEYEEELRHLLTKTEPVSIS